jgi:hypothetical protein
MQARIIAIERLRNPSRLAPRGRVRTLSRTITGLDSMTICGTLRLIERHSGAQVIGPAQPPADRHALHSAGSALVPNHRVPDTLSNGVGEIERNSTAARQHVRIDSLTESLAELDGDLPPDIVQVCQYGMPALAGSCRRLRRHLVSRRTPRDSSAGLGEAAHRMRIIGRGYFYLYPDQTRIRTMVPDSLCGYVVISGPTHRVVSVKCFRKR